MIKNENLIIKDWRNIDFSFGLIYPNTYKIGMSSYAIRLLYFLINSYDNIVCERIFLPEKVKYPAHSYITPKSQIRSIENRVLLDHFDILGFSLQFENDFKNVLWILENSLIPISSQARGINRNDNGEKYPLIIAGGPVSTSNPLPFSQFFDLMFIGDCEPNLNLFFKIFENYKHEKINYKEFLKKAQEIEGIYVPALNNKVKRAVQNDLDSASIPDFQILSNLSAKKDIFEQKYFVEINRGCPYQCKFCLSSFHNAPFRNRSYEKIIEAIDQGIRSSTFEVIGFIGSCVSAHPKFYEICEYIINNDKRFSIPSIRIDHLSPQLIEIFELDGIKTITIAPESGSESLRYALGKEISDEKIYSIAKEISDSKIRNMKFYFIIGLPNENDEDIQNTITMIKLIDKIGFEKKSLRIIIKPLIPKLNTPYESEINFFLDENINKLKSAYQEFQKELKNIPSVNLKFQDIRKTINEAKLQTLVSLGDKEISSLLTNYYLEGANFGALRKAVKIEDFSINEYFMKIRNGYIPWKMEKEKKKN